ncbi:MAG: hypothetical protein JXA37_07595 [Chloroflexia bacterium]|nr:hypothetical protein [Chloroflexia bacterium]
MATLKLQVSNLPAKATESQVRQALGPLGRVTSVKLSGSGGLVEIESAPSWAAIDSSGLGEIRLNDVRQIDSSGLGELGNALIRPA